MAKRTRHGSLLFPLALIFLGVMFLLSNLGVIDRTIWSEVTRYWPVLLILVGVDALLQRPSPGMVFGTVITAGVIVATGITLFYVFSPDTWNSQLQTFQQPLNGATTADIELSCRDCSMNVGSQPHTLDPEDLISGSVNLWRGEHLTETVREQADEILFRLESDRRFPFFFSTRQASNVWEVDLNGSIPLSLSVTTSGIVNLDLTDSLIKAVDISAGDETCAITLPSTCDTAIYVSGERIELLVPADVGVRVSGSMSTELTVPPDYIQANGTTLSPNYDTALHQADIVLRPGCGWIDISPVDN